MGKKKSHKKLLALKIKDKHLEIVHKLKTKREKKTKARRRKERNKKEKGNKKLRKEKAQKLKKEEKEHKERSVKRKKAQKDYKEKTKKVIVLGGALKKHGPKERHIKAAFGEDKREREKASKAIAKAEKKMKASHVQLSRKGHEKSLKERARKEKSKVKKIAAEKTNKALRN